MSKLWGGRFKKETNPLVEKFTSSIDVDKKLARYDVLGSIAHARMLGKCVVIPKKDSVSIIKGLEYILKRIDSGDFTANYKYEDIHSQIQDELFKKIGESALRMHTARSRNDQVCLDVRLYCKDAILEMKSLILKFQKGLLKLASSNKNVKIAGYTHLQRAQVVSFAQHILAYMQMFSRDLERLDDVKKRVDVCPLGSLALSGTTLNIDRHMVAKELGFKSVSENSMDSVSDRDFVIEIISAISILFMHLSRMSEDMILWCSSEFGLIDIDESFCTGSSLMPHKKNPDVLELVRGSSSLMFGNLTAILVMTKGLALTYNRDMQWDKKPLFESVELACDVLKIMESLVGNIKVQEPKNILKDEFLYATDIAEYLVRKDVPFKEAHRITGEIVRYCVDNKKSISSMTKDELEKISKYLDKDVLKLIDPGVSVNSKISYGSTGFKSINAQINKWGKKLKSV